jgi:hypothetical protein
MSTKPYPALHYNVHFKSGALENCVTEHAICGPRPVDIDWVWIVEARRRAAPDEVLNRVTEQELCGIRPQDIDFVWVVEEKRNATPKEIRKLCKGEAKRPKVTETGWCRRAGRHRIL